MFERLLDVLGNPHFEAYVGGPIVGVLVSLIFASFGNRSSSSNGQSPQDIYVEIIERRFHERPARRGNAQGQNNGDGGAAMGLALVGLGLCFLFVAYLPKISFGLCFFITSVSAFTISTCLLGVVFGQFNTFNWWRHTIFPSAVSIVSLYSVVRAENAIDINVVNFAQGLLGNGPLTFVRIIDSTVSFYKSLNDAYVKWIFYQIAAFAFSLFASLEAFLQWFHYIALANSRDGSAAWATLAIRTSRFGSLSAIFTAILFSALAWLCASGMAYSFFHG
jgi:hypothetical protein